MGLNSMNQKSEVKMGTDAYALIGVNNEVLDVIMADDIETAKHFLNGEVIKVDDWAEVGWHYHRGTNLFAKHPEE